MMGLGEEFPKKIKFKIRFEEWVKVNDVKVGGKSITATKAA